MKKSIMQVFNIRQLKNNPSAALRAAHDDDMVVVMNGDKPTALLVDLVVDLEKVVTLDIDSVKVSLAISLFKDGVISLSSASRMAKQNLLDMMTLLSSLDIPLTGDKEIDFKNGMNTLRHFLNKTSLQ